MEDTLQREWARLMHEVECAKSEGKGQAAMAGALIHVRRATMKVRETRLGVASSCAPLLKNAGDNKRRKAGGGAAGRDRAGTLLACAPPRARKPKQLRAQLAAKPK